MLICLMLGSHIGPYVLKRLLGEGGMAAVYEGENEHIERRVAIKVLYANFARQPDIVNRFLNEARAVNRVAHPSIVQVHEHGQLPNGTAYMIMEYLEGETLSGRLANNKRLPFKLALQIAWQIAGALTYAHSKGIIHRDLKPGNLMLVPDPLGPGGERVKILDFGIAKLATDARGGKTASQVLMGTPMYMSPEQCRGAAQVDGKTDVYSLGVILYQVLAGRPPFVGEGTGDILGMHLFHQAQPLSELAPEVPAEVAAFVHLLLQKDREQRPSMAEASPKLAQLVATDWTAAVRASQAATLIATSSPFAKTLGPLRDPNTTLPIIDPSGARTELGPAPRRKLPIAALIIIAVLVAGAAALFLFLQSLDGKQSGGKGLTEKPDKPAVSTVQTPSPGSEAPTGETFIPIPAAQEEGVAEVPANQPTPPLSGSAPTPAPRPTAPTIKKPEPGVATKPGSTVEHGNATARSKPAATPTAEKAVAAPATPDTRAAGRALERASFLVGQKQYDDAILFAMEAIKGNRKDGHTILGMAACAKGDLARASVAYRSADSAGQKKIEQFCLTHKIATTADGQMVPADSRPAPVKT